MATMRYTQSAREMTPRMMFSIKFSRLKFFAADCVEREHSEEHEGDSDINGVEHKIIQA